MYGYRFQKISLLVTSVKLLFAYQACRTTVSGSMSRLMRSVKQNKLGGPQELYINDKAEVPKIKANEILIRVYATAVNRADLLMREGKYPGLKEPTTLGLEVAGIIDLVGAQCTKWKVGERVMALVNGGGYAEYASVNEDHVMPVPKQLSFQHAAAIPEVWLTAFQLLHFIGKLKERETVLIHAGGSGVGTAAIQLANLAGAKAIITAGTDKKVEFTKSLGAFHGINYKMEDFDKEVGNVTEGKGVNVILDCVGGSYWKKNAESLAVEGRWIVYGLMGGMNVEGPLLRYILGKRATITGTTLKSRSDTYKAELVTEFCKNALPYFDQEKNVLKPIVDKVFPFESVAEAHKYMASNANIGKIILSVQEERLQEEL